MKYIERITQSKEQRGAAVNKRAAEAAEQQLNVDIFTVKGNITDLEQKIEDAKGQIPFNAGDIIKLSRTLKLAKEDLGDLEELQSNEFGA